MTTIETTIYPVCGHQYRVTGLSETELADLRQWVCPTCAVDMAEFEAMCEAEHQASLVAERNHNHATTA